ncbi:MAG: hypothetical protein D6683_01500 [Actinomyces sp.]|nr:MAG: hypothetical protein D6683_01500 [Actinomyces sp.]
MVLLRNLKSGADIVCRDVTLLPNEIRLALLKKTELFVAVPSDPHVVMSAFRSIHQIPNLTAMIVRREWTTDDPITAFRNRPIFPSRTWNEYLKHFCEHYERMGVPIGWLIDTYEPDHDIYHLPFLTEVGLTIAWAYFEGDERNLVEGAGSIVKELLVPHFSFDGLQAVGEKAKRRAKRLLGDGWFPYAFMEANSEKFIELCVPNLTNFNSER